MALYTRFRCKRIANGTHLGQICPAFQCRIPRPRLFRPISAASGASGSLDDLPSTFTSMSSEDSSLISSKPRPFWEIPKIDKEMIAKLGFGAFCAYGVISNINAGILITIAWLTVVKTTGKMPIAEGNWPTFLAVYAGFWISSHFMRPFRLSLAIAAAPLFDRAISAIMEKTGIQNKIIAFIAMLVLIALGTVTCLGCAILAFGGIC